MDIVEKYSAVFNRKNEKRNRYIFDKDRSSLGGGEYGYSVKSSNQK